MVKLKTGRHTSPIKEARKSIKKQASNKAVRSRLKTIVKKVSLLCEKNDIDGAKIALKEAFSSLDKAAKTNIIHKNKASKKKSRLSKKLAKIKN